MGRFIKISELDLRQKETADQKRQQICAEKIARRWRRKAAEIKLNKLAEAVKIKAAAEAAARKKRTLLDFGPHVKGAWASIAVSQLDGAQAAIMRLQWAARKQVRNDTCK